MMSKIVRLIVVLFALVAFGMATVAVAADFYVVKGAAGKVAVTDKKPADVKSIVKGPFKTKAEAENAMKAASAKKPAMPPAEGC
ncbi:MAG: hypothetical protein WBG50_01175 [Desulfomonilaceae bacterium]